MENWKPIKGFESHYMVSDLGNIKSLSRRVGSGKGYMLKERLLKPVIDKEGYHLVGLSASGRKLIQRRVHRLVALHFIQEDIPAGAHVCHKDDNRDNNTASNLYIGNHESNVLDRYRNGKTKLTEEQVISIRALKGAMVHREIAVMFNISTASVSDIINRKKGVFIK